MKLKIENKEIQKPNSLEFRRLLNQFKRDVNNDKFEDELLDYLDEIVCDNLMMIDYISFIKKSFDKIQLQKPLK